MSGCLRSQACLCRRPGRSFLAHSPTHIEEEKSKNRAHNNHAERCSERPAARLKELLLNQVTDHHDAGTAQHGRHDEISKARDEDNDRTTTKALNVKLTNAPP